MAMVYPMQMLLPAFTLLLAFPFATSTTSKEEIKCDTCTPEVYPSPPPPVIECPPPPAPPSAPPPAPPSAPPPAPPSAPPPSPPVPSPCTGCPPPCSGCKPPCSWCPPPCSACPPPPCNACQIPQGPPRPQQQPGVVGGAVYPPPNGVVPYFPYGFQNPPPAETSSSSSRLKLKLVASIIFLLLSATFSFF